MTGLEMRDIKPVRADEDELMEEVKPKTGLRNLLN
jgi:hypothetical protein